MELMVHGGGGAAPGLLNDEDQSACIDHSENSPLVVLAGPGSGKTHVLCLRMVKLLNRGVPEEKIFCVTFTTKAAQEMKRRLSAFLGRKHACNISTIHSLGFSILREHYALLGYQSVRTLDAADQSRLVKAAINGVPEFSDDEEAWKHLDKSGALAKMVLKAKEKGTHEREEVRRAAGIYVALMKEEDRCDFQDMVKEPLQLLQSRPDLQQLHSSRVQHLLVDEFQDTSSDQWKLLSILAKGGGLTAVGDVNQGIYGFRGASSDVFKHLQRDFPRAEKRNLSANYRCHPSIVHAAAALISHNDPNKKCQPVSRSGRDSPTAAEAPQPRERRVVVAGTVHDEEELELLMRQLTLLVPLPVSVGVLCRTNKPLGYVRTRLRREKIPFIGDSAALSQHRLVLETLAYLRLAADAEGAAGDDALRRVATQPPRNLRAGHAVAYANEARSASGKQGIFSALCWAAAKGGGSFPRLPLEKKAKGGGGAGTLLDFAGFAGFEVRMGSVQAGKKGKGAVEADKSSSGLSALLEMLYGLRRAGQRGGVGAAVKWLLDESPYAQRCAKAVAPAAAATAPDPPEGEGAGVE
eukprot:Hpha_TRINITY_DN1369_c0_g1::TRINITY_DN1369_c0_g1_i1::g.93390::m.93390/K03657/uvrD, pcrA; DNA helicase II / ATP-dependent DNA helicase PcrA